VAILLPSIILHEISHGWVASRFGDDTARRAGRLTLNPIPHIDPLGSVLLPAMLALAGSTVFGWARPVPVNPARFSHPTRQMAIVALAGPATNLALAAVAGRLGPFVDLGGGRIGVTTGGLWVEVLYAFVVVNVALAVFNMLPIPPLDGSRLLPLFLPEQGRIWFERISQYGFLILFALIFLFDGVLAWISRPIGWLVRLVI
jgi:Zn-dependent protease